MLTQPWMRIMMFATQQKVEWETERLKAREWVSEWYDEKEKKKMWFKDEQI